MRHRNDLPHYLNAHKLTQFGAEIGVQQGQFAEQILKHWNGHLYLVDPWAHQPVGYIDGANVQQGEQDKTYDACQQRLLPFSDRLSYMRMLSHLAAPLIADELLDFVYIDGNHSYEAVKLDLVSWYPKIKPGGLLSGHDYRDGIDRHGSVFGVKKAVDEFAQTIGRKVETIGRRSTSWMFHK